jgi:adenine-specific DNA-methyltransferase
MKPIIANDPQTQSTDLTAENLEQLKGLFPEAFTEGKLDFEVLKQLLGGVVDEREEKYGLNWHGKRRARQIALTPSTGTLRPCPEDSVDWDTTQNLMIEGDNLEVLKLLQKSYAGKVKLICIDPPYNTGRDFVYTDNFQDNIRNYLELTGQVEGGQKISSNTETSGRFHTDWLNMMYPRLKLCRNLLRDDGVIFVSIDDSESDNLRKLCDEVFGEEHFINTVSVNMKNIAGASGGGEDKKLKKNIEYLHIYAKNYDAFSSFESSYEYIPIEELVQQYRDEGASWKYTSVLVNEGDKHYLGSTVDGEGNEIKIYARRSFVIKSVNQVMKDEGITEAQVYLRYAKRIFQTAMPQSSIRPRVMAKVESLGITNDLCSIEYRPRSGRNKGNLYEQFYKGDQFRLFAWLGDVAEEKDGRLYKKELQGTFWDFASETKNLTKEGDTPLPNGKKPVALVSRMLELDGEQDSVVLDFFAGSGTTGHAIFEKNSQDGGSRRFILVQLQEPLDAALDDQKIAADFCDEIGKPRVISELTKERLRRAAKKIKAANSKWHGDQGFRVFKLDASNLRAWEPQPDNLSQSLADAMEHIKPDRTEQDVLFELLLKLGLDLTVSIETKKIAGKTVHSIGAGTLIACLAEKVTAQEVESLALGIVEWHAKLAPAGETQVVFRDSAFADDVAKTNLTAILQQHGLDNVRSL